VTRGELEDERSFLLSSLEDLDREYDAGDLSDEDHQVLRDSYIARAAEVIRALDAGQRPAVPSGAGDPSPTGRRPDADSSPSDTPRPVAVRSRRILMAAALVVAIGCVVWAVADHASTRLPGESATGSVTLSPSQQTARTLDQAETLENDGNPVEAVKLYESVLRQDPTQEQALAEVGWLEYEAGAEGQKADLLSVGEQQEQEAERVAPTAFAPHLYLGSMLLAQGDATGAVAQYRLFLAEHPPRATVTAAVPFIMKAFSEAHLTPPALPLGTTPAG
jgi:tetratricopeptide (TPR) repeat protein